MPKNGQSMLERFKHESASTMRALQGTAVEVNKVAVQAGLATQSAATTLSAVGNKLTEKGGALDQISQGSAALAQSAQTLNASTLPRAARAADEAAKTARSVERVVSGLGENPQSLIFGTGNTPPGPGEPGFTAPTPVK